MVNMTHFQHQKKPFFALYLIIFSKVLWFVYKIEQINCAFGFKNFCRKNLGRFLAYAGSSNSSKDKFWQSLHTNLRGVL